ncbi:MAG: SDR family NAD(P)-dependent oxidoreductase [Marinilabiliales bacterium]|nr:MAG: SDR family NAD(P)-dependent oxidoreductase [Marinilabiliales bacterium]
MHILITGTSRGLGEGLALHYLDRGDKVFGISRNDNRGLEKHQNFKFLPLDLSDFDGIRNKLPGFLVEAGHIDIAILNAGVLGEIKDMGECSLDEIERVMDINVWANKVLIDTMYENLERISQVVAVSSGAAVLGNRGWNAYSISKAALNMMIKLYAREREETHFSAIAPGLIDSAMQDYIYSLADDPRFPSLRRLKDAKSGGEMPSAGEAAETLAKAVIKAHNEESGSFIDVREI